jgi:hypothetical protein
MYFNAQRARKPDLRTTYQGRPSTYLLSHNGGRVRPLSYIASIVSRLGFCSSQKPGQIEKHSCNSLSDTLRCGNILRQFAVISALKKGLSFTTFGKKECFKR